jgi:hypothetical protein
MMTATKNPNYTAEMTTDVVEAYKAGESVESIATRLNKTTRSIVAKLAREGVYQAKTKARAEGSAVRKADLITDIAHSIGTNEELLESLEKATKEALELIAKAVKA